MAIHPVRAIDLVARMEQSADDLESDARAVAPTLTEAQSLLGADLPDVSARLAQISQELRENSADLRERARVVAAGGPRVNEGLAALERVRSRFEYIESRDGAQRPDGILSRKDLLWARSNADDATAEAARWLLENGDFYDKVETALGNDDYLSRPYDGGLYFDPEDRDGLMSMDDIEAFLDKSTAWSVLAPRLIEIDTAHEGGVADGFISREDFESYLRFYDLPPEVSDSVRQVLEDGAYHRHDSAVSLGAVLDAVSFLPVVGDVVDGARAAYYALHGDYGTAALFALGLVPLPGLSSSGVRGALKAVDHIGSVARKSGTKEAFKAARRIAVKGTAANYGAYQSAMTASEVLGSDVNIDESVDYALEATLPTVLDEEHLDPVVRRRLSEQLAKSLNERLSTDGKQFLNETNRVIAQRIAEHHANEVVFKALAKR